MNQTPSPKPESQPDAMPSKKAMQRKKAELQKKLRRNILDLDIKNRDALQAVAVKYDFDRSKAPKIIASGRGLVAQEILKIAEDHKIPFFEDPSLAEVLGKLEVDSIIPAELFTVVAEVLAFVYQLDKLAKKRSKVRQKFAKLG